MSLDTHINNITAKANKILSFWLGNLQIKLEETKSLAHKSMVRLFQLMWLSIDVTLLVL
jgi:hypothetical protein